MTNLTVFGVDFHSANLNLRNTLAFTPHEIPIILNKLRSGGVISEGILLSTCNRIEFYAISSNIDFIINALCDFKNVCPRQVRKHSYIFKDLKAANHLFRVVCGLESMVLGETEIVSQVKEAMDLSKANNTLLTNLSGLLQMALSLEKEVRAKTLINDSSISIGAATYKLVMDSLNYVPNHNILFIGAGNMMQKITPYFANFTLGKKTICNRSLNKAKNLALTINASILNLEQLKEELAKHAIIVSSVASQAPVLTAELFASCDLSNKLIIDLSMPLVFETKLLNYEHLKINTVDDIAKLVDVGLNKRKAAASKALTLINNKLDEYQAWLNKRAISPVICELRRYGEEIRRNSVAIAEKQLLNGVSPQEVLEQLSIQLTNRLLHNPTVNLSKEQGKTQEELISVISNLYNLNPY